MAYFQASQMAPSWRSVFLVAASLGITSGIPIATGSGASLASLQNEASHVANAPRIFQSEEHVSVQGEEQLLVLPESIPDAFKETDVLTLTTTTTSSNDGNNGNPRTLQTSIISTSRTVSTARPTSLTTSTKDALKPSGPAVAVANITGNHLERRDRFPLFTTLINLMNGTPYEWRRGYIHSYQIRDWEKAWPKVIKPGVSADVFAKTFLAGLSKDTAGEVVYHIMGTSKPMSFMVEYRKGMKHQFWIRFLDELETINSPKNSEINLGLERRPGGIGFVLAGKEGDFVSNDPPVSWMQAQLPYIGRLPLREIIMPMSHHAGLWKSVKRIGFGMPINTQTHDVGLDDQITNSGVRVFDVRPAKFDGEWRESHGTKILSLWHGMLGAKLLEMIDIVNRFCQEHPGELFIWNIHPTDAWNGDKNFRSLDNWDRHFLYETFKKLNNRISVPDNEDLTQWPLERFIGNKTSAVLIRFDDSWVKKGNFPGGAEGFVSSSNFPVNHRWSETGSASKMAADQLKHLRANRPSRSKPIFHSDWLLTQVGIKAVIPQESIRKEAGAAWAALFKKLWEGVTDQTYPNWIALDAMHGNELKATIMAMNHCYVVRRCGSLGGRVREARNS